MSARNIGIAVAILAVLAIGGYFYMSKGGKKPAEAVEAAAPAAADGVTPANASTDAAAMNDPFDATIETPAEDAMDVPGDAVSSDVDPLESVDATADPAAGSGDVFETAEDDFVADGEPIDDSTTGSGHGEETPPEDPPAEPNN